MIKINILKDSFSYRDGSAFTCWNSLKHPFETIREKVACINSAIKLGNLTDQEGLNLIFKNENLLFNANFYGIIKT